MPGDKRGAGLRGPGPVIAVATHERAPDGTDDDLLACARIAARCSAFVEPVVWNAPSIPWAEYSAVLIRSTWDYHRCLDAFLGWAAGVEAAGTPLWNPAPAIRWNADKRYLMELELAGIPIVPTEWIPRGNEAGLRTVLQARGWCDAVVKPSVGATSYRTERVRADEAETHAGLLAAIVADSDALVQPFLPEVVREGEWSFIFFEDGVGALAYSHALLKRPRSCDFRVQPDFGGSVSAQDPPSHLLQQVNDAACRLAEVVPGPLLYARLDGVMSDGTQAPRGTFLMMEAELIEPMLFFSHSRQGRNRFAEAVARRLAPAGTAP